MPPNGQPRYTPGVALQSVRRFDGCPDLPGGRYLVEMEDQLGLHRIPYTEWSRELRLKLKDEAVLWYKTQYKTQSQEPFPRGGTSPQRCSLLSAHNTRQLGHTAISKVLFDPLYSTGAAALEHIDGLTLLLERLKPRSQRAAVVPLSEPVDPC